MELARRHTHKKMYVVKKDGKTIIELDSLAKVADYLDASYNAILTKAKMDTNGLKAVRKDGIVDLYQNEKLIATGKNVKEIKEKTNWDVIIYNPNKDFHNYTIIEHEAKTLYEWYKNDVYQGIFDPVDLYKAGIMTEHSFYVAQQPHEEGLFAYLSEKEFDCSDTKLETRYLYKDFFEVYKNGVFIESFDKMVDLYSMLEDTLNFTLRLSWESVSKLQEEGFDLEFVDDTISKSSRYSRFNLYKNNELIGENITRSKVAEIMGVELVDVYQFYRIQREGYSFKTKRMYWYFEYSDKDGKLIAKTHAIDLVENYGMKVFLLRRALAEDRFYQVVLTHEEMGYLHGDKLQTERSS